MYLDITYLRLLQNDFWTQTLQQTPASMYIRPLSRRLHSWLQSIMGRQSARHWWCRHVAWCQDGVLIALLIAANDGQISPTQYSGGSRELAPTSLHSSYEQSRKQSAASITLFDLNDGILGDTFVCATSRNSWPFDTLVFFLPAGYNIPRL